MIVCVCGGRVGETRPGGELLLHEQEPRPVAMFQAGLEVGRAQGNLASHRCRTQLLIPPFIQPCTTHSRLQSSAVVGQASLPRDCTVP